MAVPNSAAPARAKPSKKPLKRSEPALIERITRSLAFMLRHQPEQFDLEVDAHGFADVGEVVRALNERLGEPIERDDLLEAVESGDRVRYEIEGDRIRALYGHSIPVEPGPAATPPEELYVAIPERDLDRAQRFGLRGGRRRFLHLALTPEDARESGRRGAKDYTVLAVRALDAWEEGVNFYDRRSLWLAEELPTHLLDVVETYHDGVEREARGRGGRPRGGRGRGGRREGSRRDGERSSDGGAEGTRDEGRREESGRRGGRRGSRGRRDRRERGGRPRGDRASSSGERRDERSPERAERRARSERSERSEGSERDGRPARTEGRERADRRADRDERRDGDGRSRDGDAVKQKSVRAASPARKRSSSPSQPAFGAGIEPASRRERQPAPEPEAAPTEPARSEPAPAPAPPPREPQAAPKEGGGPPSGFGAGL